MTSCIAGLCARDHSARYLRVAPCRRRPAHGRAGTSFRVHITRQIRDRGRITSASCSTSRIRFLGLTQLVGLLPRDAGTLAVLDVGGVHPVPQTRPDDTHRCRSPSPPASAEHHPCGPLQRHHHGTPADRAWAQRHLPSKAHGLTGQASTELGQSRTLGGGADACLMHDLGSGDEILAESWSRP